MASSAAKPGRIVYQCRRCGKFEKALGTSNMFETMCETVYGVANYKKDPLHPRMTDLHVCEPGIIGVMDLIGAEP
jgi:hypothetical protein